MPPHSDDAMEPLVHGRSSPNRTRGITTNRILSIVSLVFVAAITIAFQLQIKNLSSELTEDEKQIKELKDVLSSQAEVIQRFNNSVSNSDVIKHLNALELELNDTQKGLQHELKRTEDSIANRLQQTLTKLDETVSAAEKDIHQEVNDVKKDMDVYARATKDQFSAENDFMIYQLAGTFTLLSGLISMWHMTAHLRGFNQPVVQRKILAILWMSPIYAVTSWLSLVFLDYEGYFAIIKDFYEAYVIYQFLSFCIAVLGRGDREKVVDVLAENADHLTPPFRCCGCFNPNPYESDRDLANAVLLQCQTFAMQFVFIKPTTGVALFVLEKLNYYGAGDSATDYRSPQFYIVLIQNLSVFTAFTGLLKFYHAVDKELAWCRPFAKFCCIKGVVFMTFWQGLAISILASETDVAGDDAQKWARSSQNFLICLEMLLFSIAHFYCFPVEEWEEGYRAAHSEGRFGDSIALNDFLEDLKVIVRRKSSKKKSTKRLLEETLEEVENEDDEDTETGVSALTEETESLRSSEPDAETVLAASRLINSLAFGSSSHRLDEKGEESKMEEGKLPDEGEEDSTHRRSLVEKEDQSSIAAIETVSTEEYAGSADHEVNDVTSPNQHSDDPEMPPDERTSLLGGDRLDREEVSMKTPNDEMLRPSIFTTVASMGDSSANDPGANSGG